MDPQSWQQTVSIAQDFGVLSQAPDAGAYRSDLAEAALQMISGDTTGASYQKVNVQIIPGGE